jgi:valyl-tRNA synthetase
MKKTLDNKYNPKEIETGVYDAWVKAGYFTAGDKSKPPFTIVIPPPNVTGRLHLGHAWDTSLQDIISRFKRMQGYDMLWLSGMDHAGIATQAKVDARLKEQGISRYDLGREKFLEKAWAWKEEYAAIIRQQWAKLGLSLDYSRERFTLDSGLNDAVNKVFVQLYQEGLIYQGRRIINWDPQAQTALSNIEVIHKEIEGSFYTFKYKVVETGEYIKVSTTRPETMFGDVCVVVHPEDERYKHIHGMHVENPANHEILPILVDDYIDMEFGTGAMKCTPAHDANDFALAVKYNLEKVVCMHPDATMNERAGEYEGMDRFACRKALTERITKEGNTEKIEQHIHQVGHSERTDVIVEPYLSKQWFVKMKPLAQDVLDAQKSADRIDIIPLRFENIFERWLENIEDWCISRQLWWGHRIPVWYHNSEDKVHCDIKPPLDIENWHQDEDVLDTWFSSALWPFSTLGWPEETDDLKRYYPTSVLVTGYDIIFFWAARMAFQARHFTHTVPFHDLVIHGLIRDSEGRKMSKSLGNGVDPMEIIDQYGADALRYFLCTNSAPGQDLRYSQEKVEASWNFINKIYNASRFVALNLPEDFKCSRMQDIALSPIDLWISQRFDKTLFDVTNAMEKYDFALAGSHLYAFIWDDFCSWYIELAKSGLNSGVEAIIQATRSTLKTILIGILKMLHPFMPFVTEAIYTSMEEEALCVSSWPSKVDRHDEKALNEVTLLISLIGEIRALKIEYKLKPATPINILLSLSEAGDFGEVPRAILEKMVKTNIVDHIEGETVLRTIVGGSFGVKMSELVDIEEEKERLGKEIAKLDAEIDRCESMLKNERFVGKAPVEKIDEERRKLAEYKRQKELTAGKLEGLK